MDAQRDFLCIVYLMLFARCNTIIDKLIKFIVLIVLVCLHIYVVFIYVTDFSKIGSIHMFIILYQPKPTFIIWTI